MPHQFLDLLPLLSAGFVHFSMQVVLLFRNRMRNWGFSGLIRWVGGLIETFRAFFRFRGEWTVTGRALGKIRIAAI